MSHPSLAGRAALAVVLLVGFYVLALAIVGGLLYLPYIEVVYLHRLDRLTISRSLGLPSFCGAFFHALTDSLRLVPL